MYEYDDSDRLRTDYLAARATPAPAPITPGTPAPISTRYLGNYTTRARRLTLAHQRTEGTPRGDAIREALFWLTSDAIDDLCAAIGTPVGTVPDTTPPAPAPDAYWNDVWNRWGRIYGTDPGTDPTD